MTTSMNVNGTNLTAQQIMELAFGQNVAPRGTPPIIRPDTIQNRALQPNQKLVKTTQPNPAVSNS